MASTILAIGASRNIGYFSALRFLQAGATVTYLLRTPSAFDNDVDVRPFVQSGKAILVKGDALIREDVSRAWNSASEHGPVDLVLFTVGGIPQWELRKGFFGTPANLVAASFLNMISTIPKSQPPPKIIGVSSTGLTKTSHDALPLLLKPFYGYALHEPHRDKVGMERIAAHVAGWEWDTENDGKDPVEDGILERGWMERDGMPAKGEIKGILIIRPSLLTDGKCKGDKKGREGYRASEAELGGYTVSRKDVAHFVFDAVTNRWSEFENKRINISY